VGTTSCIMCMWVVWGNYKESNQTKPAPQPLKMVFDSVNILLEAVPQFRRLVAGFPPRRPGFETRSGHVGFVVDKVELGHIFSECFGFPCQFSFHRLLHIHNHPSYSGSTIGQLVADAPRGLSLTRSQIT
jgi:hypothetical protein